MLEATGERLVPEASQGELVLAEHLARYRLASRLAPGRRVLDAACGEGYGSAMLAAAGARETIAVDLDAEVVAHVRERHGIDARVGDVTQLPFPDASFDLAVSFETIEHVRRPEAALDELRRVLGPGGLLVVSTPNPREYRVDNPFHVRELDPDEFAALLRARFGAVRILYQQNFLLSAVLDADRLTSADATRPVGLETTKIAAVQPGHELYTLALCGVDEQLPAIEADVAVAASVYEAHELAERLDDAVQTQGEWQARATEAERVQAEWQARATEAERIRTEWQARATEAERQNEELRATLNHITASVSWRIIRPLRSVRRHRP